MVRVIQNPFFKKKDEHHVVSIKAKSNVDITKMIMKTETQYL